MFTVELPAVVQPFADLADTAAGDGDTPAEGEAAAAPAAEPIHQVASTGGTVLVIDDEEAALDLTRRFLSREGFTVMTADNGMKGLELARAVGPDAIILDVNMLKSGFEILGELRDHPLTSKLPILFLSGLGGREHRARGLVEGADDYMVKPFAPRELVARAKRLVARAAPREVRPRLLVAGPIEVDMERHEIRVDGRPLELTRTEFGILELLCQRPGRVRDRSEILDHVSEGSALARTVDVHIASVRKKLGDAGALVETVRGVGYRLNL